MLKDLVNYYVMVADKWRHAPSLEAVTVHHRVLFLDSSSNASDIFHSGSLNDEIGCGQPDGYRYDPAQTNTPEIDAEEQTLGASLVDQSVALALIGKQLVYHSAPFETDTEISGFFKLIVWIGIDCPDTDFYVSVHDIDRGGASVRLSADAMRARYREGLREARLVQTTEPLCYTFDRFSFVSRIIQRGHRLRLIVAPIGRLIDSTFAEKNFNNGGLVAEETSANARAVTVRLHHDAVHQSALYVPIGRGHGASLDANGSESSNTDEARHDMGAA